MMKNETRQDPLTQPFISYTYYTHTSIVLLGEVHTKQADLFVEVDICCVSTMWLEFDF